MEPAVRDESSDLQSLTFAVPFCLAHEGDSLAIFAAFNCLLITFSYFSFLNIVRIVGKCVLLPTQTGHVRAYQSGRCFLFKGRFNKYDAWEK